MHLTLQAVSRFFARIVCLCVCVCVSECACVLLVPFPSRSLPLRATSLPFVFAHRRGTFGVRPPGWRRAGYARGVSQRSRARPSGLLYVLSILVYSQVWPPVCSVIFFFNFLPIVLMVQWKCDLFFCDSVLLFVPGSFWYHWRTAKRWVFSVALKQCVWSSFVDRRGVWPTRPFPLVLLFPLSPRLLFDWCWCSVFVGHLRCCATGTGSPWALTLRTTRWSIKLLRAGYRCVQQEIATLDSRRFVAYCVLVRAWLKFMPSHIGCRFVLRTLNYHLPRHYRQI